MLPYLPKDLWLLYNNAFVRFCFSYCSMFWFNNDCSDQYKRVDNLQSNLKLGARVRLHDNSARSCNVVDEH